MDWLEELLMKVLLDEPRHNHLPEGRTISTKVVGKKRISVITRPDGSTFKVTAALPRTGAKSGPVKIEY